MEQELSRVIRLSHLGPELVVPPQSLLGVLLVQLHESRLLLLLLLLLSNYYNHYYSQLESGEVSGM